MKEWYEVWPDRVSPSGRVKQNLSPQQKLEIFIYRANQVHEGAYDYSKSVYKTAKDKIIIICPLHGEFLQRPENHILQRAACPACYGSHKKTTQEFIADALTVHGGKYNYSRVDYKNAKTKVTITCPIHGDFLQTPADHINNKRGCPSCGGTCIKTTGKFVCDAQDIHGDRYDYSLVDYVNSRVKVTIKCREHGEFEQTPYGHLQGNGCPLCIDQTESTHVYLLDYGEGVYKIGITSDLYGRRLPRLKRAALQDISVVWYGPAKSPKEVEQKLLKTYQTRPVLDKKFDGYTELRVLTETEVKEICSFLETI